MKQTRKSLITGTDEELPRLLYLGDVPVEDTTGGSALLHRMLLAYPREKLLIVEGSLREPLQEKRVPGAQYRELNLGSRRLAHSRLGPLYFPSLWIAAPLFTGRAERQVERFRPEAVLTVAHGISWRIAASVASRSDIPLHLIVHDDRNAWGPEVPLLRSVADRTFGSVYHFASSRLCVSPYMRESYRIRYGVVGQVLYPLRAANLPEFKAPPPPRATDRLTIGFAGSMNHMTLPGLQALLPLLKPLGLKLIIYSPDTRVPFDSMDPVESGVRVLAPLPPRDLVTRLREEADILFLPMSFDALNRPNNEHSFPSKLTDYTATGLPILVWGPSSCSAVRWAMENPGVAQVVDVNDPQCLMDALLSLVREPSLRASLGSRALAVGHEMFSNEAGVNRLQRAILENAMAERIRTA
jgi:glycosyltransferase involved in cell wall biosynthesis